MAGENEAEVGLKFETNEQETVSAFEHIARAADHLHERWEHLTETLIEITGLAGAMAGAFSLAKMIDATQERIQLVQRLNIATGLAAGSADGLMESFERVGMSGEEAAGVIQRMSLQALKMDEAATGMAGGARQAVEQFRLLGVDLRRGTVPALLEMSQRVKEGHLSAAQLQRAIRMWPAQAQMFIRYLKQGPEEIRKTVEEVQRSGSAITSRDIERYNQFIAAKAGLKAVMERMTIDVGRPFFSVLTTLMETMSSSVRKWADGAREFGSFLVSYLHEGLFIAKKIGATMAINYAMDKFTGSGLLGHSKSLYKKVGGYVAGGAGIVGGNFSSAFAMVRAGAASVMQIVMMAGRLTGILAVIGLIVAGVQSVINNVAGARDMLVDALDNVTAAFENLFEPLSGLFDGDGPGSQVLDFLRTLLPNVLNILGNALAGLIETVQVVIRYLHALTSWNTGMMAKGPMGMWSQISDEVRAENEARVRARQRARAAADRSIEGKAEFHQNFYSPRFDITQKFEEGFDPDRILTAFTRELAALGERGMQSGFAPGFTSTGGT